MTEDRAGAPAWLLVASGLLTMIYSVVYIGWTLLAGVLPLIGSIGSVMDGSNSVGQGIFSLVVLLAVPAAQALGFCLTLLIGAVTAFGGFRLNAYRSKGVVWLAIVGSTLAPVLSLFVNAGSALNIGALGFGCITGCILGNIPTLVLLVFGAVASCIGLYHLSQPEAAARFDR